MLTTKTNKLANSLRRCLVFSLIAGTCFGQLPVFADVPGGADIRTINSYLSWLAEKNGTVSTLPQYHQTVTQGVSSVPTVKDALTAIHHIPTPQHYGESTHTADPTSAEVNFVSPVNTDADGNIISDATPGYMFGTISGVDQTLTGQFDDLAIVGDTPDPYASTSDTADSSTFVDPTTISPTPVVSPTTTTGVIGFITGTSATTQLVAAQVDLLNQEPTLSADNTIAFTYKDANAADAIANAKDGSLQAQQVRMALLRTPVLASEMVALGSTKSNDANSNAGGIQIDGHGVQADAAGVRLVAAADRTSCMLTAGAGTFDQSRIVLKGFVAEESFSGNEHVRMRVSPDFTAHQVDDGSLAIDNGFTLLTADETTTLSTSNSRIAIDKHAIAYIEVNGDCTKIRACSGPGHVAINCGTHRIQLNVGEEAIVSSKGEALAQVALKDGIAKRHISKHESGEQGVVLLSEFSMPQFMLHSEHVAQLRSSESRIDRNKFEQMLKSAAALQIATRRHGRYFVASNDRMPQHAFLTEK